MSHQRKTSARLGDCSQQGTYQLMYQCIPSTLTQGLYVQYCNISFVSLVYSFAFLSFRSICEMNLEAELFTLQDSNSKLVAALHEANANVEQLKKQLAAYQEETERLRDQVSLDCVQSDSQVRRALRRCPA